jgi:hypothetical protein
MQVQSYFDALGLDINKAEIAEKNGFSYLSAATAMKLAGLPEVEFAGFGDKPFLTAFNGSLVAVDIGVPLGDNTSFKQRTWLPVMNQDNLDLDLEVTSVNDINNNQQRCLVKAVAATLGYGMSVFLGHNGSGSQAVKMLGVKPDSDLTQVPPVVSTLKEGGAPYVEWTVALAAARVTDPTFHWEVLEWDGLPYREVLDGIIVDVATVYRGKRQVLSRPLLDSAQNPVSPKDATVSSWNKAVMRALAKGIAFNTGYGIEVYSKELIAELGANPAAKGSRSKPKAEPKADNKPAEAPTDATPATSAAATPVAEAEKATAAAQTETAKQDAPAQAEAAAQAPATEQASAPAQAETAAEPAKAAEEAAPAAATAEPAAESKPATDAKAGGASDKSEGGETREQAVARFKDQVMPKRNSTSGTPGLITLFDDLEKSNKFLPDHKPACFGVLVQGVTAKITPADIHALVGAIQKHNAMQYVAQDALDLVAARLTKTLLEEAAGVDDDALCRAVPAVVDAGIAKDIDDVFRLAKAGGVSEELLTLLRELVNIALSAAAAEAS